MPQRAKKLKSTSSAEYLFVHEDANTVLNSTRDAEVDRSKQRHVQRRQFAKRRGEMANHAVAVLAPSSPASHFGSEVAAPELGGLTIHSPPTDELASWSNYINPFESSSPGDHLSNNIFPSDLPDVSLFAPRPSQALHDTAHDPPQTYNTRRLPELTIPPLPPSGSHLHSSTRDEQSSPGTTGQSLTSNVFSTIPIRPDDAITNTFLALQFWAPPLIQYYTTVIFPYLFAVELRTVPIQLMRHTPALHEDMRQCMSEAAHLYALLAATSAIMLRYEDKLLLPNIKPEDYTRVPIYFKTKAMASLRHKLDKGQVDRLLALDIYWLMVAAIKMEDLPAADAHFQAMIEIVQDLGGLEALDSYLKERLILSDIWRAAYTLNKPQLHLSWDPGNLPQELHTAIGSEERESSLGLSFYDENIIKSNDLLQLIQELAEVVEIVQYSYAHPLAVNNFQWVLLRRTAIEHKLISSIASQKDEKDVLVESAMLSTLIWIEVVLAYRKARDLVPQIRALKSKLESADMNELEGSHSELLLWISTTAAIATDDEATKSWFVGIARVITSKLQVLTVEDLEEHLHRFLYVADLQRDSLSRVTDEIIAGAKGKGMTVAIGQS